MQAVPNLPNVTALTLPLTHPTYHILLVLAAGERHGHGLKREIAACTGGFVCVGNGTLYRSIDTLLAAGLIDAAVTVVDPIGDVHAPRRLFRLTDLGERIARAETERLVQLVALARRTPRLWDGPIDAGPGGLSARADGEDGWLDPAVLVPPRSAVG